MDPPPTRSGGKKKKEKGKKYVNATNQLNTYGHFRENTASDELSEVGDAG